MPKRIASWSLMTVLGLVFLPATVSANILDPYSLLDQVAHGSFEPGQVEMVLQDTVPGSAGGTEQTPAWSDLAAAVPRVGWGPVESLDLEAWRGKKWVWYRLTLPAGLPEKPVIGFSAESDQVFAWSESGVLAMERPWSNAWRIVDATLLRSGQTVYLAHPINRIYQFQAGMFSQAEVDTYRRSLPHARRSGAESRTLYDLQFALSPPGPDTVWYTWMDAILTEGLLKTNGTVYIRGTLPRMDAPDPAIMLSSVDSLGLRVWMAGSLVYAKGTLGQDMPGADQSQELFGSDRLIPVSGSAQGQELLVEIHYNGEFIGLYGMEIRVGNRLVLVQQAQEDFVSLTLPNLALSAVSCLFGVFLILVAALRFRNDVKLLWYLGGLFLAMAVIFLPTGIMFQVFANPSGAILIYLSNFLVVSFIVLFYAEFIGAERLGWFGRFKPWLLWPSLAISGALLLVFVLSSMNLGESVEELRFMWLVSQGEWIGLLHTMFVVIAFGCVLIHMIGQKERNADYWMLIMVFGISLASTFFLDVGLPNLPWLNLTKQAAVLVSMTALFAAYLCLFAIPVLRFFRNEKLLVQRNQELQKANQVFHRFVPEEFLTYLGLQNMNDFRLGVHAEKTATIMFSDIRSFTNLAETMSPAEVLAFINTYLGLVGPCIAEAGGFIDKYLGDGIMAIFPESPRQGVAAALAMQAAVDGFNRSRDQAGLQPIQVGIGLHCGPVMLGTIGHQDRIDGTVLSDTVNTAARLESLTKLYRCSIIVGESVQAGLPDPPPCNLQFLDKIRVKGKRQAVAIYRVLPKLSAAERPALAESDSLYNEVWRLQSRGDLSAALAVLAKVPPRARLEGRWKLMAKRLERLEKLGVPPGWDGIDSLALK